MKSTKFYRNAAMLLLAGATIIPQCLAVPAMADSSAKPSDPAASCAASKDSLNNYLWDLHYDKTNILARHGETINNKFSSDSFNNNGEFVVVEHQKKNITNTTSNLSVTSANNDRVYPGALFRADQNLMDNMPSLISANRAPLTLSIDLPGFHGGESAVTVQHPTKSSVTSAVNGLVSKWNAQYAASHHVAARMQYDSASAQSMNQLKAKFGADFAKIGVPLKIDFDAVHKGEKQTQIVNFKQTYYTVSVDAPDSPADFFAPCTTPESLKNRGVDAKRPPVYVSNVAYGRSMYVKFDTTSKSTDFQAAVEAAIKGVEIKPNTEFHRILQNTSVTAVILGGSADGAAKVITGNIDTLKALIQEGANLSTSSPAVPIAYTTSFVKDNEVATLQSNSDYVETKVSSYRDGYLTLDHRGAYVARYYVYWDEYGTDIDGTPYVRSRAWEGNGKYRTAHFSTTIQFKGNVRNLRIKLEEKTGLVWEPWRTVYNRTDLPLVRQRTIKNWGTTLWPRVAETVKND